MTTDYTCTCGHEFNDHGQRPEDTGPFAPRRCYQCKCAGYVNRPALEHEPSCVCDDCEKIRDAAPEMARMLLDIQWEGQIGGYEPEAGCPRCGADPPSEQQVPARRIDAWNRTGPHVIHRGGHKRDCDLGKLLEAAGLPVEWDRSFTT